MPDPTLLTDYELNAIHFFVADFPESTDDERDIQTRFNALLSHIAAQSAEKIELQATVNQAVELIRDKLAEVQSDSGAVIGYTLSMCMDETANLLAVLEVT